MMRVTDKTIRAYLNPTRRQRPKIHDAKGDSRGFAGVLQSVYQQDSEKTALRPSSHTVRDYIRTARALLGKATPMQPAPVAISVDPVKPRGDATSPTDMGNSTAAALKRQIDRNIHNAARKYDLSPRLLRSLIRHESNFDPQAVSSAGAMGLMQLMPDTARDLGIHDPFDVEQNIDGGARYLRQMLDRFRGNRTLALAAYNAGPGTVERYGGVPPYPETQHYVQKVLSDAQFRKA